VKVTDFVKGLDDLAKDRDKIEGQRLDKAVTVTTETPGGSKGPAGSGKSGEAKGGGEANANKDAKETKKVLEQARLFLDQKKLEDVQAGQLGVDLSLQTNKLRNQNQLSQTAVRRIQNRNCLDVGGIWIDESFAPKMPTLAVKAMSKAYFRILERQPSVRDVFRLGNHLVWVTPSGTALVIDGSDGREEMSDADIDRLFIPSKK
jgi:hypothetical protein